jgi:hypothetical protein
MRLVRGAGVNVEIPVLMSWESNIIPLSGKWTMPDGQFYWGGILLKRNGGVQSLPHRGWSSRVERKGIRQVDCETYKSSRDESRT